MRKLNKKYAGIVLIVLAVITALAYLYFNSDGKASLNIASTSFPSVTRYNTPDNLSISFQNTADIHNKNYRKQLNSPIAPLNMIGKEVTKGVSLSPAISGTWKWTGERTLTFMPKQDWPANQDFIIRLDQSLFDKHALKLADKTVEWVSPYFQASIQSMHLEQDIAGGKDHNIFATITFTHPVDRASLEKNLKLLDLANSKVIPFD